MAITVTATQGGSTANGFALRVFVLTGARQVSAQSGASTNNQFTNATSFTQSITTTAGSNVYGASARSPATAAATGSNTTIVDDVNDTTNNERYTTFKALNVTGAATIRGYTCATASGPFAQLEILAAGTLAEDASAPAGVNTTGAGPLTTASFTPPGGSLLVALIGSDGGVGVTTFSVSNTGTALNWTEKVKNNPSGGDYAGVWVADVPLVPRESRAVVPVPRRTRARGLLRGWLFLRLFSWRGSRVVPRRGRWCSSPRSPR